MQLFLSLIFPSSTDSPSKSRDISPARALMRRRKSTIGESILDIHKGFLRSRDKPRLNRLESRLNAASLLRRLSSRVCCHRSYEISEAATGSSFLVNVRRCCSFWHLCSTGEGCREQLSNCMHILFLASNA